MVANIPSIGSDITRHAALIGIAHKVTVMIEKRCEGQECLSHTDATAREYTAMATVIASRTGPCG
ncbi:hypothetical protein, partial [Mycolicibacterium sp. CBMA 361]|uniref:hypothetical protein n=1 Tax=Mycolicibacterium sp. CBMA 361 TaxID=2606610 RepID=UPI001EEFFBD2